MAIDYQQTDTAAPCGSIQACSPVAPAADADAKEAVEGGTAGTTELACDVAAASSELCYADELAITDSTSLDSGNATVRINVTTAQNNLTWEEVYVCRLNSSCTSQETLGSATGLAVDISAGGVFSHTLSLAAASAHNAGDVIYVAYVFANGHNKTARTVSITPDQLISTPYTASSGSTFTQSLTATATGTPSRILGPGLNLTTSATGTASLSDVVSYFRTLTASATGSPSLLRKMFQTISATASGSATLSTALKFVRTLSATASAAASLVTQKTRGKLLSATATGSATLSRTLTYLRTLSISATGSASVSLLKTFKRTLSTTASATPNLIRKISFTLSALSVGQLSLSAAKTLLQSLTGSATGSATLSTNKTAAGTAQTFTQTLAAVAKAKLKLLPWPKNPAGRPYEYVGGKKWGAERGGPDIVEGKASRIRADGSRRVVKKDT